MIHFYLDSLIYIFIFFPSKYLILISFQRPLSSSSFPHKSLITLIFLNGLDHFGIVLGCFSESIMVLTFKITPQIYTSNSLRLVNLSNFIYLQNFSKENTNHRQSITLFFIFHHCFYLSLIINQLFQISNCPSFHLI